MASSLFLSRIGAAHGVGFSELHFRVDGARVDGTWSVHARDGRLVLEHEPTPTEDTAAPDLRADGPPLHNYLVQRLSLTADGKPCAADPAAATARWQGDQRQIVVPFAYTCPAEPVQLTIAGNLLFDRDPKHRTYFSLEDARVTHLGMLRDEDRSASIDIRAFHLASGILEFLREGIAHIWGGLDHVLFLLTLLLPAPLVRGVGEWIPRGALVATLREVLKVVTAFTAAHSLTLALSFFGVVTLPAQWVEVGIALSVFAAAWNNLRPFLPGRAWGLALAFGLVHGLGFAGALRNLALPTHARGLALAAFNLGVEIGQLAIAGVLLPLLWLASKRRAYPRLVLGVGSFGIAWLAMLWVLERAFGFAILPGS